MYNIYFLIQTALDTLAILDPTVYPNLCYYSHTSTVFRHLEALLRLFQSKDKPVATIEGQAYFLFAQKHIRLWSKEEESCGGTETRWQSHKIFLMDLGLIKTYPVTGECEDPVLNRIWETAKTKKFNCETLWTVPLYSDSRLQAAERIAGKYRECHVSIAHLRKNVIIRFRGKKRADWLYWPDARGIGQEEVLMLSYCHEAIRTAVEAKGYTTFKEMETRVHAFCTGRLYFQQQLAELLNPEETERQKPYWSALNLILQEKRLLCLEVGCEYRQIRRDDRETLALPKNMRCWIIVPL